MLLMIAEEETSQTRGVCFNFARESLVFIWDDKQAEHSVLVMANTHWWLCLLTSRHKYPHYPLINPQCLVKSIDDKAVMYLLTKILAHKHLEFHC